MDLSSTSFWAGRAFQVRSTHCVPASVDRFLFSMLHGQRTGEIFNLVNNFLISNVVLGTETAPGHVAIAVDTSASFLNVLKNVTLVDLMQVTHPTSPHPSVTSRASSKLLRHVLSTSKQGCCRQDVNTFPQPTPPHPSVSPRMVKKCKFYHGELCTVVQLPTTNY